MAVEAGKVRRRIRAFSQNRAQEITEREKKLRSVQPDNPCHVPQDSLLSSSSGYTNYRGFLNLCIVLLALSNARVALENIIKYGILADPVVWTRLFFMNPANWPSILITLGLNLFILASLKIEIFLSENILTEFMGKVFITLNLLTVLAAPPVCVYTLNCHPIGASIALGFVSIVFLKLVSYHMTNFWCRENRSQLGGRLRRNSGGSVSNNRNENNNIRQRRNIANGISKGEALMEYPDNLNLKDIYYFILAPTLSYELNFPRSERVRKRFLIKRIVEMLFLVQLILGLVQQWMVPIINNSQKPLKEMDLFRMLERLLKLAVPNHLIWLIFFYWFFHSCLNAVAEILKFSDRQFYRDWWNAETVNYFWQNWNIPVHKWCVRHLYVPLITMGCSKLMASTAVFCVSAFFHEYLVSVPLKMFRIWAFSGMLLQLPFAMFVNRFMDKQSGNFAVWISLIIGQPLCILMYYHDYYVINLTKQV